MAHPLTFLWKELLEPSRKDIFASDRHGKNIEKLKRDFQSNIFDITEYQVRHPQKLPHKTKRTEKGLFVNMSQMPTFVYPYVAYIHVYTNELFASVEFDPILACFQYDTNAVNPSVETVETSFKKREFNTCTLMFVTINYWEENGKPKLNSKRNHSISVVLSRGNVQENWRINFYLPQRLSTKCIRERNRKEYAKFFEPFLNNIFVILKSEKSPDYSNVFFHTGLQTNMCTSVFNKRKGICWLHPCVIAIYMISCTMGTKASNGQEAVERFDKVSQTLLGNSTLTNMESIIQNLQKGNLDDRCQNKDLHASDSSSV